MAAEKTERWEKADERPSRRAYLLAGIGSGVIAGLVTAYLVILQSIAAQLGPWYPARLVAAAFLGVSSLVRGSEAVLLGLAVHLAVSVLLALIFTTMVRRDTVAAFALLAGSSFGAIVWAVATFLVLPIADPVMSSRLAWYPAWWFADNLIFGGLLHFLRYSCDRVVLAVSRRSKAWTGPLSARS